MHLGLCALVKSIEIHPLKFNSKCERGNGPKKREQFIVSKVEFNF